MSSTVTVTARCADCSRVLVSYYGVPRGPEGRKRLVQATRELLDWHRAVVPTCKASGTHLTDRAEPR
jgi:hypothetical protein